MTPRSQTPTRLGRRRLIGGLLRGVPAAALLAACRDGDRRADRATSDDRPAEGSPPPPAIRRGGTFVTALLRNPDRFDPMVTADAFSSVVNANIFDGLLKVDEQFTVRPWLAERIEQPDEPTTILHLRAGVPFHDGTDLDAEAVTFSIDRIRGNPAAPPQRAAQEIAELTAPDRQTLRLVLKQPSVTFSYALAGPLGWPVSPTAVRDLGDRFARQPVGAGPFRFGEWKQDGHVRVERFDRYWRAGADGRPLPYLDRVEWRIITEQAALLLALQAGDLHAATVRAQDLPTVRKDPTLSIVERPGTNFGGLWLTIDRPPFDSKPLRQALAHAIDREEVVRAVFDGSAVPANGPIAPVIVWAHDPAHRPYAHDLATARAKLAEGGRPGGFAFECWAAAGDSVAQQLAELYQAQLARVGIAMQIQFGDLNGVILPKLRRRESNAYQDVWFAGFDPDTAVTQFEKGHFWNSFPYDNPRVSDLVARGRRTFDRDQRGSLYKEIARLVADDAPCIFVSHGMERFTASKAVQGFGFGPRLSTGLSELWLAD